MSKNMDNIECNVALNKICRMCMVGDAHMINIYKRTKVFGGSIFDIISSCVGIKIAKGDGLPEHICGECLCLLDVFYKYILMAKQSDTTLRKAFEISQKEKESIKKISQCDENEQIISNINKLEKSLSLNDEIIISDDMTHQTNNTFQMETDDSTKLVEIFDDAMIKTEVDSLIDILEGDNDDYSLIEYSEQNGKQLENNEDSIEEEWNVEYLEPDELITELPEDSDEENDIKLFIDPNTTPTAQSYLCNMCNKYFTNFTGLSNHLKSHINKVDPNDKPFCCPTCNKTFKYRSKFTEHTNVHNNIRPFECKTCSKCFSTTSSLKLHENSIHYNIKPYLCTVCYKAFPQKCELTAHMRTHTNEKPYNCSFCEKSFALKKYLRYHENLHTGNRPYKCEECGKGYARPTGLQVHRRTHALDRTFRCNFCANEFSSISHFSKHKQYCQAIKIEVQDVENTFKLYHS